MWSTKCRTIFAIWWVIQIGTMRSSGQYQGDSKTLAKFNSKLFSIMSTANRENNLVYSPISLQTLMATVYLGAKENTADEMKRGLQLPDNPRETVKLFENVVNSLPQSASSKVIMANKMYYGADIEISKAFIANSLKSEFEGVNFGEAQQAAYNINSWVAQKTENRIRNLMSPDSLSALTKAVLLNAIYFKGLWKMPFSTKYTEAREFENIRGTKKSVETMYQDGRFSFGRIPELDACMVEMPYEDSKISMYILLPNEKQDLSKMEHKFTQMEWTNIIAKLHPQHVAVLLPKFRIAFEQNMIEPFQMLGIKELFSRNANLKGLFPRANELEISEFRHKAYLDVNEAGSEAAAASFLPLSDRSYPLQFLVNRPFMFIIGSPEVIYFMGHIVDL